MSNTLQWLRTAGPDVVDEQGTIVRLRGVGVGGWLNMENFITGFAGTESAHRRALRETLGQRRCQLFFDSFLTHFFGPADAAFIASLGLNCVRIPVSYRHPGRTTGHYVNYQAVKSEFRTMTEYMRDRGLPVWVGEFGPVYGADPERDTQRRRLLADQIDIYEAAGAGWSVWTYKDIGVQGLVTVDPQSPWLTRTAPARAKKQAVAADYWGMTTDAMSDVLEPLLARFGREFPGYDPYPFGARRYVEQLVLNICLAEPLAGEFAACLDGLPDEELDVLGRSFAFANCSEQKDLCEIVSPYRKER